MHSNGDGVNHNSARGINSQKLEDFYGYNKFFVTESKYVIFSNLLPTRDIRLNFLKSCTGTLSRI